MNLLTEQWIPVRPLPTGASAKITLRVLLCEDGRWEICLPRDDMELAALQLLVCMIQVLFPPKDAADLKQRIVSCLPKETFDGGCTPYRDWFQIDHPDYPFMQVRGVEAKEATPMEKLLAGLTGATNSCFVNEPGLGARLCGGCAAIALFNQSSNAPSFGGGFKGSLRGAAPITTLVQGEHLRQTVWLNVLSEDRLIESIPWYRETRNQRPTCVDPIIAGKTIQAQKIGLFRGLFWQPAHIELMPPAEQRVCSCCGSTEEITYRGFDKAKFSFTVTGLWPHPHGPRISMAKKGERIEKFISFTTTAPAWTLLSRFVVQRQMENDKTAGQEPAAVIRQAQRLVKGLRLNVGGYRTNKASILERRHELIFLNDGWSDHVDIVHELVALATGYRDALNKALFDFVHGFKKKKIKGAGVEVREVAQKQFYRRSEVTVLDALSLINFSDPAPVLLTMGEKLHQITETLFNESVGPYLSDPELIRTIAISRKTLRKHLKALKPQQDGRSEDGKKT